MDELFFSDHDNYYSFASDDSPPPSQEWAVNPLKGPWMHICK